MAKRGRKPADIIVKDGPISEGLREAIEASGLSKYRLAEDAKLSKPQFYRFMKGERSLSQEALNRLAKCLGVRMIVQRDETLVRTESGDSAESPATKSDLASASVRPDISVHLCNMLAELESAIDEEFAALNSSRQ